MFLLSIKDLFKDIKNSFSNMNIIDIKISLYAIYVIIFNIV